MKKNIFFMFIFQALLISFFLYRLAAEEKKAPIVTIANNSTSFTPEIIKIKVGETVKWINNDKSIDSHMFASIPGSGPTDALEIDVVTLAPNQTYEHTFNQEGEYPYFCFIHRNMSGKIVVEK